ncbi:NKL protein, partial [Anseranas semipalmata]|nr:NKL protein [Anseranas semipalmata]
KGKKCIMCTKLLKQLKKMVGDNPDEEAIEVAMQKVCSAMGKRLGWACKKIVKKYREQIYEALQNDEDPQDTCATMKLCK